VVADGRATRLSRACTRAWSVETCCCSFSTSARGAGRLSLDSSQPATKVTARASGQIRRVMGSLPGATSYACRLPATVEPRAPEIETDQQDRGQRERSPLHEPHPGDAPRRAQQPAEGHRSE